MFLGVPHYGLQFVRIHVKPVCRLAERLLAEAELEITISRGGQSQGYSTPRLGSGYNFYTSYGR
jgi:hypothetical protein